MPERRTKDPFRVKTTSGIQERTHRNIKKRIAIDLFFASTIEQQITSPEQSIPKFTIRGCYQPSKPEVVIALQTQDEQFVERNFSACFPRSKLGIEYEILAVGSRMPFSPQPGLNANKLSRGTAKKFPISNVAEELINKCRSGCRSSVFSMEM